MVGMEVQSSTHRMLLAPFEAAVRQPGASVADAAYRTLRRAIVTMVLPPGERLSEQELANRLAISRQPVREALLRLRAVELVEVRPKSGSFVARISVSAVQVAQFVREAVESAIARRAGCGLPAAEAARLDDNLARQRAAAAARNSELFFQLDEEFHRLLAQSVGCGQAWKTIEDSKAHMDRVRYLSLPDATPLDRLIGQHAAIVEGIAATDPEAAAAAMQRHLREIVVSLPMLARQHPALFDDPAAELEAWRATRETATGAG